MKTEWDYTDLAASYLKRPDYSDKAIDKMLQFTNTSPGAMVCDVGAGVAHLTLKLAARDLNVVAVEPNDAMRELGIKRTSQYKFVKWCEGTGEQTNQKSSSFDLVTFGSSFNVTDRTLALKESCRILKSHGWFTCMWNHRNLNDPLQAAIEEIIQYHIPGYDYGARREDQTIVIRESGLFGDIKKIEADVVHEQSRQDCIMAWKSHATLHRQAGDKFDEIISNIEKLLNESGQDPVLVPYSTVMWIAQSLRK